MAGLDRASPSHELRMGGGANGRSNKKSHSRVESGDSVIRALLLLPSSPPPSPSPRPRRVPSLLPGLVASVARAMVDDGVSLLRPACLLALTCRNGRDAVLPLSRWYPFLAKVGPSSSSLFLARRRRRREGDVDGEQGVAAPPPSPLFWQACALSSSDVRLAATAFHSDVFLSLTVLYLNENRIGDDGAIAVAENAPLLRHLSLASNLVTDGGACVLLCGLRRLREINLRDNPVSPSLRDRLRTEMHRPNRGFLAL